mgnify:FL=1
MSTGVRERADWYDNYIVRNLYNGIRRLSSKKITLLPLLYLTLLIVLAVMGPYITPYSYDETLYNDEGEVLRAESPSLSHPLGTTNTGQDVLSRVIYGVQPTVVTGLLGGAMIISIGLTMGVVSGYVGGLVDNVLMRITDIAYSVPLIPFAIVLLTLLGVGFYSSVIVIGLLLWRGNARVLRSQVLQIKQRPFVRAAKATGASTPRIIVKHILPNVASMAVLFFALGIGYSIIAQAGLAFIGASNPFVPSWGVMIRNAYQSGYMAEQLGWSLIPGLLISMTVLSAFLIGRGFEQDDKAFGEAG